MLIVGLCLSTGFVYPGLPSWLRFSMLFWGPFALLIYWFAVSDGGRGYVSRLLRCRALVALGGISFEVYMIHGIVIAACVFAWGRVFGYDTVPNAIHFAMCLVVSVVVSKLYSIATIKMSKASLFK